MKNKVEANLYRDRYIFISMTIIAIIFYFSGWLLDKRFDKHFEETISSLYSLKTDNVSEIKIYKSTPQKGILLATLSGSKDEKVIEKFISVLNDILPSNAIPRELILSHGLYLVIDLNNSNKSIELVLNLHKDCKKTVYINEPSFYRNGYKSESGLYNWLQNIDLIQYLSCG